MKNRLLSISLIIFITFWAGCSFLTGHEQSFDNENLYLPATSKVSYEDLSYSRDQILVRVKGDEKLSNTLYAHNSEILQSFEEISWQLISVPDETDVLTFIEELESQGIVSIAEPNLLWEIPVPPSNNLFERMAENNLPPAEDYERLWGMEYINAPQAWQITKGHENVIVAIIDTGLVLDHPEFANHTIINPHNTAGDSLGASDFNGHGTHVAGTAAADGRYGKLAGVVWDCPLMPIRVMNPEGAIYTNYITNAVLNVANYVKENPQYRAVINMSLGGRGYSHAFKDAIDYALEEGVVIVAAAGNDQKRILSYPSAYNGVICVASSDAQGRKSSFSNYGYWASVAAPGEHIWSAHLGDSYQDMQGTSMASPHVCGAAALLLSHNRNLTPLQVKNQLEQTAMPGVYGGGFREMLGHGIIDLQALLGPVAAMQYGSLQVVTDIISTGDLDYGVVTVFDQGGNMVCFGATGLEGMYSFHAMQPGSYTVTLSFEDEIHDQIPARVEIGETTIIRLEKRQ